MKFTILQKSAYPQVGVMSISAYLKQYGYKVDVHLGDVKSIDVDGSPDVIGFSFVTNEYRWAYEASELFRHHHLNNSLIPTIAGGPHATLYPEHAVGHFNYIIQGEGEEACYELLHAIEEGHQHENIPNVYPNAPRPLTDITTLPEADRSIYYDKFPFMREQKVKSFVTGRGCPYHCGFCDNHLLQQIYKGQKYVRKRTVQQVIDEIKHVRAKYPFKYVTFADDVFTIDPVWLKEFCEVYPQEIHMPFICNMPIPLITQPTVTQLAKAGCHTIEFGIESGNDFIRNEILHKVPFYNWQVMVASQRIHKAGMKIKTYNMINCPTETLSQAWETVRLNQMVKPVFAACTFCTPFPKYDLTKVAQEHNTLSANFCVDDVKSWLYDATTIRSPYKKDFVNLQAFFQLLVLYPHLEPIIKPLLKLPPNALFHAISKYSYGYYLGRTHGYSLWEMIKLRRKIDPAQT